MPEIFNVNFLERAAEPGVMFGSKAVGEPPLMLAISVREAIREAIAAYGGRHREDRQPGNAGADLLGDSTAKEAASLRMEILRVGNFPYSGESVHA